jgi:hypothetical protein
MPVASVAAVPVAASLTARLRVTSFIVLAS